MASDGTLIMGSYTPKCVIFYYDLSGNLMKATFHLSYFLLAFRDLLGAHRISN